MKLFSSKSVYSENADLISNLSNAVQNEFVANGFTIGNRKMAGDGIILQIKKGNSFWGFFGLNRFVRLTLTSVENNLVVERHCPFITLHFTLLIFLLLCIPPFTVITLAGILNPFVWLFFFLPHVIGLFIQITFNKRIQKFIDVYCLNNLNKPLFCPHCGSKLTKSESVICENCKCQKR